MCHEPDSAPPVPRIRGAAVSHEDLVLEAADGNRLAAFAALPEPPGEKGIVVLPDVRGLHPFYEEVALRFAERGHAAVAVDYFGRTAGAEKRDEHFDYAPHVERTTPGGIQEDVRAGVQWLRERGVRSVFTVGFCFGGRASWLAAAAGHGLAGAVGFYGRPGVGRDGSPGPVQLARDLAAPILALMGGDDPAIPVEEAEELDRALDAAGLDHEVVVYPGAPHSFFDRKHEEFADASADAWRRVLAFVDRLEDGC
jgi:carboxymethylenebutenolidase